MTKVIGAAKLCFSPVNMCLFDECSCELVIFLYLLQNPRVGKGLRDHLAQCFYPVGKVVQFGEVTGPDPGDMVSGGNTRGSLFLIFLQHSSVGE